MGGPVTRSSSGSARHGYAFVRAGKSQEERLLQQVGVIGRFSRL
jgi:hypothetical protein